MRFEERRLAVQHARSRRPEHLVAGEGVEVGIERLHVDGHVGGGLRAVDRAPPRRRRAPSARSRRPGAIVPSAFDTWIIATMRVRSVRRRSNSSIRRSPRSSIGTTRSVAPVCSQTSCHGTMFEWCSIQEMSTSSPGFRSCVPSDCATRLMPSVQPRVRMISRLSRGVDEALQQHAGALVGPRGALAQQVRGAVDVRVARQVVVGRARR